MDAGRLTLICPGDARNMKDVKDNSIHLAITSPPYFDAKGYSTGEDPRSKERLEDDLGAMQDYEAWLIQMKIVFREVFRCLVPGCRFALNSMTLPRSTGCYTIPSDFIQICKRIGFWVREDIIWCKLYQHVLPPNGSYPKPGGILLAQHHEHITVFQKPGKRDVTIIPKEIKEKSTLKGTDFEKYAVNDLNSWRRDMWFIDPIRAVNCNGERSITHIAPFPEDIPERLIRIYTYIGDEVLEPFAGSGTTLKVAKALSRNCIGYEINPAFKDELETRSTIGYGIIDEYSGEPKKPEERSGGKTIKNSGAGASNPEEAPEVPEEF